MRDIKIKTVIRVAAFIVFIIAFIIIFIDNEFDLQATEIETITETEIVTMALAPPSTVSREPDFVRYIAEIQGEFKEWTYTSYATEKELDKVITELTIYRAKISGLLERYPENCHIKLVRVIDEECAKIDELIAQYTADANHLQFWRVRAEEYPAATQIWLYMKELGWNDYVCAGILGNIMAECGGHTLNIQWNIYDYSGWFYGICQWSLYYRPEASGLSLENQLDLLYNTIESEFDYAGFCYYSGFTYEDFLEMTNCRDIALAFAKVYERCGSGSYSIRQRNAEVAYEYFVEN